MTKGIYSDPGPGCIAHASTREWPREQLRKWPWTEGAVAKTWVGWRMKGTELKMEQAELRMEQTELCGKVKFPG
jgi:hypothetical protein